MKVLLINKFLYPKGGDAISTINTGRLLAAKGHQVVFWGMTHPLNPVYPHEKYFVPQVDFNLPAGGAIRQVKSALNVLYSWEAKKRIQQLVRDERPDIVHLNNFAHQLSPSILDVFKAFKIPAVMTMRDYKMVCPVYSLMRNSEPCQLCSGGRYYHCLFHKCCKDSMPKSLLNTVEMYLHHKVLRIYDTIALYVSPSQFLKSKVQEMGLKGRVEYLPNFVNIRDFKPAFQSGPRTIVYVGRLSHEKGIRTLINAVRKVNINLRIIGDGPLKDDLTGMVAREDIRNVVFQGYLTGEALQEEVRSSAFLVIPSEWYENNPRSVIEAFALGKPAVGSRIGGIPELVKDGETGLTFTPGDTEDLKCKIEAMLNDPSASTAMGRRARQMVEQEFNEEVHYQMLVRLYRSVMNQ